MTDRDSIIQREKNEFQEDNENCWQNVIGYVRINTQ